MKKQLKYPLNLFRFLTTIWVSFFFSIDSHASDYSITVKNELDSLTQLVNVCPTDTGKFKILAKYFWSYAKTDMERVKEAGEWAFEEIRNSNNLVQLTRGYEIKGTILKVYNKPDSAFFYFEKMLNSALQIGYTPKASIAYNNIIELNGILGDNEKEIVCFKSLFSTFLKYNDPTSAIVISESIADRYRQAGQFDSALVYYTRKLELSQSLESKSDAVVTAIQISVFYKEANNYKKSVEFLNYALKEAEKNDTNLVWNVYLNIARYFVELKNYPVAIEYCNKGLERNGPLPFFYIELSKIYIQENNDSLALEYALDANESAKDINRIWLLHLTYLNLGAVYKQLGNTDLAILNYKKSFESFGESYVFEAFIELGNLYTLINQKDSALHYYNEVLDKSLKSGTKKEEVIANLKIGDVYFNTNNINLAQNHYLSAYKTAREFKDLALLKDVSEALNNFYLKTGDLKSAYPYLSLSKTLTDSLSQLGRAVSAANLEMKFAFDNLRIENESEQALSQMEIKKQKIYRNSAIAISILFVILIIAISSNYIIKRKDNRILLMQKKQIEEKNTEIVARIEEIKTQRDEIERISNILHETDQMKLRFFSNISHEIRTPLTLIINPLESLISSFNGTPDQMHQLTLIYNNTIRLNELTNQILDLQKLDAGKLVLNIENADIIAHLKELVYSFEGFCNKSMCKLLFVSPYNSVLCSFDKDKLTKIVSNLLSNSFKYNKAGGKVGIKISFTNNQFSILVSDNGYGIPHEQLNHVFRRYYHMESSNSYHEGTGIGLAYVKELVELMGGNVRIESEVDEGTTVIVDIPATDYSLVDKEPCEISISPSRIAADDPLKYEVFDDFIDGEDKCSVLIVEDNHDLRNHIADIFKGDFNIILAENGENGIEQAVRFLPDMIISDIMMPKMNGLEMCSILKQDEKTSHIPILLLTARDSQDNHLEGYQSGADDYIIKPFNPKFLKLKIQNMLETQDALKRQFSFETFLDIKPDKYANSDKNFISKSIEIIQQNIGDTNFTVEKLADTMAFSKSNYFRKMKALTNMSPSEFIMACKFRYAAKLLQSQDVRVVEVAQLVGFESSKRFSQAFKKYFGVLPSEYRA